MNHLDPEGAAYYALIAVGLVLIGAAIATNALTAEARGTVVAGVAAVLLLVAYRWRSHHRGEKYTDRDSDESESERKDG